LLFNVIPLDLNAPVPEFCKFFTAHQKESFLFASLISFAAPQYLERIVTADKIWVHQYEQDSKAQSVVWKSQTSPMAKKVKSQPSVGKITFTIFFSDMEIAIFVHFTPERKKIFVR
jgi:hypothetical protein